MKLKKKILYSGFNVVYESSEKIIKIISICNRVLDEFGNLILQYNDFYEHDMLIAPVELPIEGYNEYSYITVIQYNEVLRELTESGRMDFSTTGLPNSTGATDAVMEMIQKESEPRMTQFTFPSLSEKLVDDDIIFVDYSHRNKIIQLKDYYNYLHRQWTYIMEDSIKTALVNGNRLDTKQMTKLNTINKEMIQSETVKYFN
jgi:hypothetical protein